MIQNSRITIHNNQLPVKGHCAIYWMQASQRAEYNHALEYTINQADLLNIPVIVFFAISESYPNANLRHYSFMLEGLKETSNTLKEKGIQMIIQKVNPQKGVIDISKYASFVVTDKGWLKHQRLWRNYISSNIQCPFIEVETDTIIPIAEASLKEEYSAFTIRKKINNHLADYLIPFKETIPKKTGFCLETESISLNNIPSLLGSLNIDQSVPKTTHFHGGASEAKKIFHDFIKNKLHDYETLRNDPSLDNLSNMSPYLHFGQISPLYLALEVKNTANSKNSEAYLEELIIRRELAINYVRYNNQYDSFDGLPKWAKETLSTHQTDQREYIYTREELENAQTHDKYWNASQLEMLKTGKTHGYMRMYWGKKILEWSKTPREAFETAVYLNDKYEIDGRDPNGYAGIAWCFGKHDRPWAERKIFGTIRYMNANGLKRKFDADKYYTKILSVQ